MNKEPGAIAKNDYRVRYPHEPLQLFPLTNKCNALYDTVPGWTNPALAVLAVLTK
jgi:hypothetical protein